jgi:two-component system response regulator AtoC
MEILEKYQWPGNVRELENAIKRLVLLGEKAVITELKEKMQGGKPSELFPDPSSSPVGYDLKKVVKVATERAESLIIRDALEKVKWKKKEAAKLLKISYKALLYKMKRYNITT